MNTDQATDNSPTYLAYYGMTRAPFGSAVEDDFFYAEPARKQRLEILLHLAQYGDELILLTGPAGSGKTTLLQQFQQQALDTWSMARIEANGGINDQQLLEQLFQQLHLEFQADSQNQLLEKITHHYDALQRSARQGVIIVDDAEQLHIATLKNILALAALTNTDNKPLVHIILFGTRELETLLQDSELQQYANISQRVLDLQAFDREQSAHYILHRLSVANFSDTKPFTDSALHKIYKQSGGWPRRINELADELLTHSLPSRLNAEDKYDIESASTFRPLRSIAIGLFIAIIGGLLLFQDKINTWLEPTATSTWIPLSLPELTDKQIANSDETVPTPDSPADPSQGQSITENSSTPLSSEATMESSEASLAETMAAETMAAATEDKIASTETPSASIAANKPAAPAATTEPEPPAIMQATPLNALEEAVKQATAPVPLKKDPPLTTAGVTTSPSAKLELPLQQNEWLLQQNPAHFTLQLVAGSNIDTIRRFMREHGLKNKTALYQTKRNGEPWYVLLYGIYNDKPQAVDARNHLPQDLRKAKPWVRNLGGIQDTLQ